MHVGIYWPFTSGQAAIPRVSHHHTFELLCLIPGLWILISGLWILVGVTRSATIPGRPIIRHISEYCLISTLALRRSVGKPIDRNTFPLAFCFHDYCFKTVFWTSTFIAKSIRSTNLWGVKSESVMHRGVAISRSEPGVCPRDAEGDPQHRACRGAQRTKPLSDPPVLVRMPPAFS
jgi:hypothetical protein